MIIPHASPRLERGLTIIEMCISVAILGGLFLVIGSTQDSAMSMYESSSPAAVEQLTHRSVDKIAERLSFAGMETLDIGPIDTSDGSILKFKACLGSDAGAQIWGQTASLQWMPEPGDPEDGKDNDQDGHVDEGMAVLRLNVDQPNEHRVVVARGVARYLDGEKPNGLDDNGNGHVDERGLLLEIKDRSVRIHLTLLRTGRDGQPISRTARSVVALRN